MIRDEEFMKQALELAELGRRKTNPNPFVGAVVVQRKRVVGKGTTEVAGKDHAEVVALKDAGNSAKGATLYVTLEPCSHHGQTPPCVDLIIEKKIRRVVIGMLDPNPKVNGKGIIALEKAGIKVTIGVLQEECEQMNRGFVSRIKKHRPFVTVKLAQSIDGMIATKSGDSRWISCIESRKIVHQMRKKNDAILIGKGTLFSDNPRLTTRIEKDPDAPNPARYALDPWLDVDEDAYLLDTTEASTTIFCSFEASRRRLNMIERSGVEVFNTPLSPEGLSLQAVFDKLYDDGVAELLVEGGSELVASLFNHGYVDQLIIFIAPIIIGGRDGITAIGGDGIMWMEQAIRASYMHTQQIGNDIMVTLDFEPNKDDELAK